MLSRALCRLARDLPAAVLDTAGPPLSEDTQDRLGIVCPDPTASLTDIVAELAVPAFGLRHPPHSFAQLLLTINLVPVSCYAHLGGICGEHSANTFIFIHTFLRNCNVAGAGAAYIADIESPATLWDRPRSRREWEVGRRLRHSLRRSRQAAASTSAAAPSSGGWNVWQAPRRASSTSSSSSDDGTMREESQDSRNSQDKSEGMCNDSDDNTSACGSVSLRPALLREYMQRPNLRAFAAFVHGGAQALCNRLFHDGRRPDLVFIDSGCASHGSRRALSVLTRDFYALHSLLPRVIVIDGIRSTPRHHGFRLWSNVQQLACYDAREFGDVGLLCRH